MELLNEKVKHKSLGAGKITGFDGQYITIQFSNKTSKFMYPAAFENFLTLDNADKQRAILAEIAHAKQADEDKKRAEEEALKKAEEARKAALAAKAPPAARKQAVNAAKSTRVEGKPMVFYVFQGGTFDRESKSGYIWAPIANKAGNNVFHWENLLNVREGDLILHGWDASVAAISTAKGPCYECPQPIELETNGLWQKEGRRVDCDYISIRQPIKTAAYKEQIVVLCKAPYSPFDKDGNGNMGYLYEINRDLAKLFVLESAKANPELLAFDVIQKFLAEE